MIILKNDMLSDMKENWIIFDFGRTLYDPDIKNLFSESLDILNYLSSKGYNLGLTSLASHQSGQTKEERIQTIESFNLNSYFRFIYVTDDSKDALYEQACQKFDIKPENLTIVDDRTIRGIS